MSRELISFFGETLVMGVAVGLVIGFVERPGPLVWVFYVPAVLALAVFWTACHNYGLKRMAAWREKHDDRV